MMKRRVLLVEDNLATIDIMEMELRHLGYEVKVAKDGLEGVSMASEELPDLIIMDVNLPKINGLEAARRIKDNPATRAIPILAATAKAMEGDQKKCLAAGCDGYIAKPFTHRELETAINDLLKRRNE